MYTIEEFDKEKTRVLKYIMYKKRTEQEIKNKFSKTIQENLLEDIIQYLKEAEYINDKQYIEKFVNELIALKKLSIKELKYKLLSKGLSKDLIEDYICNNKEKLEQYEIQSATNLAIKRENYMEKEEIKQYLIKKGYKPENIEIVIDL